MARLSKTQPFQIYEDASSVIRSAKDDSSLKNEDESAHHVEEDEDEECGVEEEREANADNVDRRESEMTTATISSFPESVLQLDNEKATDLFTPPIIRPSFRRPESVRRMQMSSPPPFARSARSSGSSGNFRSFPPPPLNANECSIRPVIEEEEEDAGDSDNDDEPKHYPLVLLHVTLLPVAAPWSMTLMQEVLPAHVLENLHLLRSKISDTIVERGILIPHPREEYELLEERLLEALELQTERITKCGHFRGRPSTDSTITSSSSQSGNGRDSDSGLGSSGSEPDMCLTCRDRIKFSASGVGHGKRKWSIRVFAANGLMRAPTWAAAWGEMESVDVEIWPWIEEKEKRELDRRRELEEEEEERRQEDEDQRIREVVEQQVKEAYEEKRIALEIRMRQAAGQSSTDLPDQLTCETRPSSPKQSVESPKNAPPHRNLPAIYHTSQIPLSVLLKNYIFLLMQDRRNGAVLFFAIVAVFFASQPFKTSPPTQLAQNYGEQSMTSIALLPTPSAVANISSVGKVVSPPEMVEIRTNENIPLVGSGALVLPLQPSIDEMGLLPASQLSTGEDGELGGKQDADQSAELLRTDPESGMVAEVHSLED